MHAPQSPYWMTVFISKPVQAHLITCQPHQDKIPNNSQMAIVQTLTLNFTMVVPKTHSMSGKKWIPDDGLVILL